MVCNKLAQEVYINLLHSSVQVLYTQLSMSHSYTLVCIKVCSFSAHSFRGCTLQQVDFLDHACQRHDFTGRSETRTVGARSIRAL